MIKNILPLSFLLTLTLALSFSLLAPLTHAAEDDWWYTTYDRQSLVSSSPTLAQNSPATGASTSTTAPTSTTTTTSTSAPAIAASPTPTPTSPPNATAGPLPVSGQLTPTLLILGAGLAMSYFTFRAASKQRAI